MAQRPYLRRFVWGYGLLLSLVLVALAVPLINVNRFQRRIVRSLSESLGRPIHLDRISLVLFPLPGFSIDNLVVGEDPTFGAEPFVRASEVRATLRVSSLWRRRVEFSRITFTDPSINLVKTPQGRWNLEGVLLQAARIEAAPTGQARPSESPRFPYIEATGARLNLKQGNEKTPFSVTDADIALWLYSPGEWRLRLKGRPTRTDTSVSDTGRLQLDGTFGRATVLSAMPLDVKATWRNVPLGEASWMVLGHDAGLRGSMTLSAEAHGTVGQSALQMMLHLADGRRAEFVPARLLTLDAECLANTTGTFHTFTDLRCSWPPALADGQKILALTGNLPEVRQLSSATFQLGTPGIPAATLLDWLRLVSERIDPEVTATGSLTGSLFASSEESGGEFALTGGTLTVPRISAEPVFKGDLNVHAVHAHSVQWVLAPVPLALGGRDFATLDTHIDLTGYTLHLAGTAAPKKLLTLAAALPPLGDGLADALPPADEDSPMRFDLTSIRNWSGPRVWQSASHTVEKSVSRHAGRRSVRR